MKTIMIYSLLFLLLATVTSSAQQKSARTATVNKKEKVAYPLCYEVKVNILIRTVETYPSDRSPAPKWEELVQISGTLVGNAIMGRVEKIVSDKDYWAYLKDKGSTPVFTANSDYKVKDDNLDVVFHKRCPLQVNIERTEWEYKDFGRDGRKYVKTLDYRAAGINDMQCLLLSIHPYYADKPIEAYKPVDRLLLFSHYAVAINIQTYSEYIAKHIPGNGRILKWDDQTKQLEPAGKDVSINVIGKKSDWEYREDTKPLAIMGSALNNYFLGELGATKAYDMKGEWRSEDQKKEKTIHVRLEFRRIADANATSTIDPPPPPLEDWER